MNKEFFLQLLKLLSAKHNYELISDKRLKSYSMNDGICVYQINDEIDFRYELWKSLSEKLLIQINSSEQMRFIYGFLHPYVESQADDLWKQLTIAEFELADNWEKITHVLINSGPELFDLLGYLDLVSNCIAGFLERKEIFSKDSFVELKKKMITELEENVWERASETSRIKTVIEALKILIEKDSQFV